MTARASYSPPFCLSSCRYEGRGGREGESRRLRKVLSALVSPQVLAGIYPIAQIQEPYTAVGYLASRIPVQVLLHLRHPEAEDPSAEHPWCAWDICEAWAEKRGYKTAKAARNDVYRAANSLLRLALDGRLSLCFHPPGYSEQKGRPASLLP